MKRYAGLLALLVLALLAAWLEMSKQDGAVTHPPAQEQQSRTPPIAAPQVPREGSPTARQPVPQGKGFDFYVLSLSWSPTYCQSAKGGDNDSQCGINRRFGFVVHGLWPQNERGYPEFCASREQQRVPDSIGGHMMDIMPSMGLIGHQWRKHGSCSGLSQRDYFDVIRKAYERVKVPGDIVSSARSNANMPVTSLETAFIRSNPGLTTGAIAATCTGRKLEEVRICLTTDLQFRSCPEVDRQSCRSDVVEIPPVR